MAKLSLEDLTSQLRQMHGGKLKCVLLYGSAAVGENTAELSDMNVLVLVDTIEPFQLEALQQTARAWEEAGNPPPLELTVGEWLRSADIFPIEYTDILDRHRVVYGELPVENVRVHLSNLRIQTEFESMGKVLRLRQAIMRSGSDSKRHKEVLRASHSNLLVVMRAALRCAGEPVSRERETVIKRVAELAAFDATPFLRVLADLRGQNKIQPSEAEQTLFGVLGGMEKLTAWIDRLNPDPSAVFPPDSSAAI